MTVEAESQKTRGIQEPSTNRKKNPGDLCRLCNRVLAAGVGLYFFFIPGLMMLWYISDPALKAGGTPRFARRVHRWMSPRMEEWASERVASGAARTLSINDISGTEWPLFSSTFYLWATNAMQADWDRKHPDQSGGPGEIAKEAVWAAAQLVADPGHAAWVKRHWGDDYLQRENVFYRCLLIGGLGSFQRLSGDRRYEPLLREQAEGLAAEIDQSRWGILDDYPNQCYPSDVIAAIAAIRQADGVLGTDHSEFVSRSIRGFQAPLVDPKTGLPPYFADSVTGRVKEARGCSSQWVTVWAAGLWPEYAETLYGNFETHFWQERWGFAGFREFAKGDPSPDWFIHVDAGPIVEGFGTAASAFGLGAARANGRFDHAWPLATEAIVFAWPLPDGRLVVPRLLSNLTHAPYIGESALLFAFTREPGEGIEITRGGRLPPIAALGIAACLGLGLLLPGSAWRNWRRWKKNRTNCRCPLESLQCVLWLTCTLSGLALLLSPYILPGLLLLLPAQLLPAPIRHKPINT